MIICQSHPACNMGLRILLSSLTEDEQAYLEQYDELVDDGGVTENERKLLDFAYKGLGLTEERAKQLEASWDAGVIVSSDEEE